MKQQIHDAILAILEEKKREGEVLPFATSIEVAHLLHMNALDVEKIAEWRFVTTNTTRRCL